MNSSAPPAPPTNSSDNGMMIFIILVVLVILGVGGYFVYQKFFSPSAKCPKQGSDKTSNVASFVWDSGTCVANVCMDGFGDALTGGKPVSGKCNTFNTGKKTYNAVTPSGNCANHGPAFGIPNIKTQSDCESACNNSKTPPCAGYDWDATASVCNLYAAPTPNAGDGTTGITCYTVPSTPGNPRSYSKLPGKCSGAGSATEVSNLTEDCESVCNSSESCVAYDSNGAFMCNLYAAPTPTAGNGELGITCYASISK